MATLQLLADVVLHLDHHLVEMLASYGGWIYLLLFLIIFAETGLVVTPFLPGDSLLFSAGALAAIDHSQTLRLSWLLPLLAAAGASGRARTTARTACSGSSTCGAPRIFSSATAAWRSRCRASCRSCAPSHRSWPASAACHSAISWATTSSAAAPG
jgi:hypothetical protein